MAGKSQPPFDTTPLRAITESMELQREYNKKNVLSKCLEVWENKKHLKISELRELGYLGPEVDEILKAHPFASIDRSIEQIGTSFGMIREAYLSIIKDYGGFHASLVYLERPNYRQVSTELTRKVFQFVFSASALVQAYRHLLSVAPQFQSSFESARKKIFDDPGLVEFIKKLRNCYGHQAIISVSPTSTITMRKEREVRSSIEFNKSDLLEISGVWNKKSREYIARSERLDVIEIVKEYYIRTKKLHESYLGETGIAQSYGYTDMARCREAQSAISNIVSLGIILQNAKKNQINPYNYLNRYFTRDEMRRICCFQANTREQVEYMISLRDPLGLCDDDLRKKLYELFDC